MHVYIVRQRKSYTNPAFSLRFLDLMTLCRTFKFYAPTIKTNGSFYIPGGDAKVSFVDVRDIAAVASKVLMEHDEGEMRHFGKAYNITGPEALIIKQLKYYQTPIGLL